MLNTLIRILAKILIRCHLLDKMIMVRMDGGICSQMHFLLVGQQLKEKGYQVKYDIGWFKEQGKDLTGRFVRNFDLPRAFPELKLCLASSFETFFYKRLAFSSNKYLDATSPSFLAGYYGNSRKMYMEDFTKLFRIDVTVWDEANLKIYNDIVSHKNTVAIHVRRGDLSVYNGAYGNPVDLGYFYKTIQKIQNETGDLSCYLFSDEPLWIKGNMLEKMPSGNTYTIVDINGSDKGYMDMFLIGACKYQITSKGSLGKFGGFLNLDMDGRIYVFDDDVERKNWEGIHDKIEFIS